MCGASEGKTGDKKKSMTGQSGLVIASDWLRMRHRKYERATLKEMVELSIHHLTTFLAFPVVSSSWRCGKKNALPDGTCASCAKQIGRLPPQATGKPGAKREREREKREGEREK